MTETTTRTPLSTAAKVLAAGLLVACAGITVQFFSGVPGFPSIPPGPFITAAAAIAVLALPWRWAPAIGLATALFVLGGAVIATVVRDGGPLAPLADPSPFGPFAGVALQWAGMLAAVGAGVTALRRRSAA